MVWPVDPVRRDLYRQLSCSSRAGCFAPESAVVQVRTLSEGCQSPEGGVTPVKERRGGRRMRY